jgi:hypothetical protein
MDLYPFFDWLDRSALADAAKAYGGVFVVVQTVHLMALALLGGMVLVSDLRLLGVVLKDVPSKVVADNTRRWFDAALIALLISGAFMSAAVALKLYHNEMFRAKMTALAVGVAFVYAVRRPLLRFDHDTLNPWALRLMAVASLLIWFTVAACGRWIGFS